MGNNNSKLTFVQEGLTVYGIQNDVVYKGRLHDELLYCEIEADGTLRWEDSYNTPVKNSSVELAKQVASKTFFKHTPHSNGRSYEL